MLQLDPTEILGMKLIIWVFRSQERIQIDYETTPTALVCSHSSIFISFVPTVFNIFHVGQRP
jgi:hypothetical protein